MVTKKVLPQKLMTLFSLQLTIAHIQNINSALAEWCRILKKGGDLIITDFHPDALAAGGKRTFIYRDKNIAIVNYIHTLSAIREILENQASCLLIMKSGLLIKA